MKYINFLALTLLIVGGINWGLVGFFQFDLVAALLGGMTSWLSRIVYALVGLSAIYCMMFYSRIDSNEVHEM